MSGDSDPSIKIGRASGFKCSKSGPCNSIPSNRIKQTQANLSETELKVDKKISSEHCKPQPWIRGAIAYFHLTDAMPP